MASKDMALMIGVGAPKGEPDGDESGKPALDKEMDPRAAAGKALASALGFKVEDGNAVADAFEELLTQIDGAGDEKPPMGPEMMDSEPSPF